MSLERYVVPCLHAAARDPFSSGARRPTNTGDRLSQLRPPDANHPTTFRRVKRPPAWPGLQPGRGVTARTGPRGHSPNARRPIRLGMPGKRLVSAAARTTLTRWAGSELRRRCEQKSFPELPRHFVHRPPSAAQPVARSRLARHALPLRFATRSGRFGPGPPGREADPAADVL